MKYNILVLGEKKWVYDSEILTFFCEIDYSKLNIKAEFGTLYLLFEFKDWIKIDGVILRGQFQENSELERHILELIQFSGVICINDCTTILHYGSNLSMNTFLKVNNFPIINKVITYGRNSLPFIKPQLPLVLKIGNYHMGYGKSLVKDEEAWNDCIDTAILLNQTISLEPFISYEKDIRCLFIGGKITAIERKSSIWKANVNPLEVIAFSPPQLIIDYTMQIANLLNADVIGTDFILDKNGTWYLLEVNCNPGFLNELSDQREVTEILLGKINKK